MTSGAAGLLAGIIGTLIKHLLPLKTKATIDNQPVDIRMIQDFVTRKEFNEIKEKLFDKLDEQKKDFSDIRAGFSQQLGKIEGMLNVILVQTKEDKK